MLQLYDLSSVVEIVDESVDLDTLVNDVQLAINNVPLDGLKLFSAFFEILVDLIVDIVLISELAILFFKFDVIKLDILVAEDWLT